MFYREVVQAVILFGLESWVLSAAMEKMVEGEHTGFLRQITGIWVLRNTGGTWVILEVGEVQIGGMQSAATYIGCRHYWWISGWRCAQSLKPVQGRMVTRGGGQEGLMVVT